jgi:hypothetical protein
LIDQFLAFCFYVLVFPSSIHSTFFLSPAIFSQQKRLVFFIWVIFFQLIFSILFLGFALNHVLLRILGIIVPLFWDY